MNIKIALAPAMNDDRLPRPKRKQPCWPSMTDQVAHLVLRNNYDEQSLAISLTEMLGAANRAPLARLMTRLRTKAT